MTLFYSIRVLFENLKRAGLIFRLAVKSPEQLRSLHSELVAVLNQLDENELALLKYTIGHAITQWALMEERLIMVASLLLKADSEKTGLVFFSIINFQVWIAIITELFDLAPEFSSFRDRWSKIYERLRREKDNRDRIAHHYTMSSNVPDNPFGRAVSKASRIDMRSKSRKAHPLTVEQVEAFSERVGVIADDILTLVDGMRELLKKK